MMKKMMAAALCAVLMLALAAPALAEEERVIRVSGNAAVSLAADYATVQIGVNTRKETVQEAQEENAALMYAVMEALRAMGLEDKDISTSQFSVYGGYDLTYDAMGQEIRKNYYQIENMLSVTVRDLDRTGEVLDTAMAAGANTTYGITFSSTEENEAYQKALTRAVEDAAQKAQVLAAAAGKTLGDLRLVDASQEGYHYGISNVYDAKAESARGTAIVSGDVSVSANVIMEYEFQ